MKLSIEVPVYNEEKNLPELFDQILATLKDVDYDWDLTFVDDGSKDRSKEVMKDLQSRYPNRVRNIMFRRNYGQTAAIVTGIDHSDGDIVILMDADLQNDPADIPVLLAEMDKGYDVVSGWRKDRQDNAITRNLPSHIANKLISFTTGVKLHDYGCTLKAYRRDILDNINLYGEMHRFIPVFANDVGAKISEVVVRHHPRKHGKANYGLERTFKVLLDLITVKFLMQYSKKPIYLFGSIGGGMILVGLALFVWLVIRKMVTTTGILTSPFFQIAVMLFLLGFIAILMGLIAELFRRDVVARTARNNATKLAVTIFREITVV